MRDSISTFDVAVVGAGMMGSSAAVHLAEAGARVILIGPDEPASRAIHQGAFASHYDQGRIYRKLDRDPDWARFAQASIDRYARIAEAGGQAFYSPVGSLMAGPQTGPGADLVARTRQVAMDLGVAHEELQGEALRARFPFFAFPDGVTGLFEAESGGWINPRAFVGAQMTAAERLGVRIERQEAQRLTEARDHVVVTLADGMEVRAAKAIVACGAFSKAEGLLPEPVPMKVYARTVVFFEVADAEAARLRAMPSLVYHAPGQNWGPYLMPPLRYPDGKTYLKIGGNPDDTELEHVEEIKAWFRGDGDPRVGALLQEQLAALMPDLAFRSVSSGSCVTSFTASGKPIIHPQTDRLIALTGGNGASAKSGDELGRLGAVLALGGDLGTEGYGTDFRPAPLAERTLDVVD